jgi:hypothetical protein
MSDDRGDFLARWSRRKREASRSEPGAASGDADPARRDLPPDVQDDERSPASISPAPDEAAEPAMTEAELAALPKIEEISEETDIAAFFRKGVPDSLRNAALRRMWSVDPAIRDYVGDARDYAWDWNTPGSVPGSGPLLPGDDAEEVLRTLFSNRSDQMAEKIVGPAVESGQPSPDDSKVVDEPASRPDRHAAAQQNENRPAGQSSGEPSESQAVSTTTTGPTELQGNAAVPLPTVETRPADSPRRRHGSARPV